MTNHQLSCVIVDDEDPAIQILTSYCKKVPRLDLKASFRDPIEALAYLSQNDIALAFLDINMPGLTGLQLTTLIKNKSTKVIFCTAYPNYAVDSYDLAAVDYLLKPVAFNRFVTAIDKITPPPEPVIEAPQTLFIKSGLQLHKVELAQIRYLKKEGHYLDFHLAQGHLLSRMTMDEALTQLPQNRFVRIHKSYVVAIDRIDTITKHDVIIGEDELPIGASFRQDFLAVLG